ncbi:MAG: glutamate ABC transporter substrate-binding protein [Micromonosporaceae bacterium]|nr:glutamate ABC transporter substrate-binding protein [Micromonosporaceae bacterium]
MRVRLGRMVALAAVLMLALAGCGGTVAPAAAPAPTFAAPVPPDVEDPAAIPAAGAAADNSCQPLRSFRPPASMPQPGQMPAGTTMATIAKRGRLVLGTDQNNYLFSYRDASTGQIVGFDVDVAREVARAIFGDPNRIQIVAVSSAQRIPAVRDGTVDLVAQTMTINCDRWKQVSFSTDYFDAGQRVLVPKNSSVTRIEDLAGKKVCSAKGSTSIANLVAVKVTPKPIPVGVNDWTDCLVMLQQDQVQAISTDDTILAGLAAQDPNTKLVGPQFTQEPYGIAISQQHTDFVRFVNGVLARIRADGTWARLYAKWLGGTRTPPPAQYKD